MIAPYYQDGSVTIYNCDYRDILADLPKPDLLLTDPPYGLGDRMKGGTWGCSAKYDKMREWDSETPDISDLLRLDCNKIIWGGNYFPMPPSRCWLSWSKTNVVATMASMELAWTNLDRPAKEFRGPVGRHDTGHPTQKPLQLISWCIGLIGGVSSILDTFMGSGTTLVAAKQLGIKAIGVEINRDYCEMAVERLRQEYLPLGI